MGLGLWGVSRSGFIFLPETPNSLISAVITGVVNVVSTFLSILTVDKVGRRFLFLESGFQMLVCRIIVGTLIGVEFGTSGQGTMSKTFSSFVVTFICIYVAGFA
ncbi:hypothetical protein ZOSMA_103G00150 [Zostera marina]|uniref:Major facilitator superfamily (MFS) profile domain-containing protein n=1 Tax=Zostera marina TaxID=29655 RepID=A0A0K9Q695_ZOSMR|nr:hypothetical protein ZOSMA_103G00150 [Zostera marina]